MSCCIKIELLNIPKLPDWCYDANGNVSFDLAPDTKYARTKKSITLNDFDKLTDSAVIDFSIPKTDKNRAILQDYGNTQSYFDKHKKIIPVRVYEGSCIAVEDSLRIISVNKNGWEVELFNSSEFWKTAIENLRLCDVELDEFILDLGNLLANWNAPLETVEYRFPLVNYGNWSDVVAVYDDDGNVTSAGRASISDFRPWVHIYAFLKKAFCQIGWDFSSPILDSDWGQRLIVYMLGDLNTGLDRYAFRAIVTDTYAGDPASNPGNPPAYQGLPDQIKAWDDSQDPSNFYEIDFTPPSGVYFFYSKGLSGRFRFKYRITIDSRNDATDRLLQFKINEWDGVSNNQVVGSTIRIGQTGPGALETFEESIEVDVYPDRYYTFLLDTWIDTPWGPGGVIVYSSTSGFGRFNIVQGSEIWTELVTLIFRSGAKIFPNNLMDCNKTVGEMLRGVVHLIGRGLFETDIASKKVSLYHQDEATLWDGSRPESFYKDVEKAIHIESELICDTETLNIQPGLDTRYYKLGFVKTSDEYCRKLGYDDDYQPFTKTVDFGEDFIDESIKEDFNKFFEPTINDEDDSLEAPLNEFAPIIPFCWDNDEGKLSTKLEPRILLWEGYKQQISGVNGSGSFTYRQWYLDGILQSSVPTAYQYYPGSGFAPDNTKPTHTLIYGESSYDLYTVFWRIYLAEISRIFELSIQGLMNRSAFANLSFRALRRLNYKSKQFLCKLKAVEDFDYCKSSTPQLVLRPTIYDPLLNCDDIVVGFPECINFPSLEFTYSESRVSLVASPIGLINSPVVSDMIYWRYPGEVLWNLYTGPLIGCQCHYGIFGNIVCTDRNDLGPDYGEITFQTNVICDEPSLLTDEIRIQFPSASPPISDLVYNNVSSISLIKTVSQIISDGGNYKVIGTENTSEGIIRWTGRFLWIGGASPTFDCSGSKVVITLNPFGEDIPLRVRPIEFRRVVIYADDCPSDDITILFEP